MGWGGVGGWLKWIHKYYSLLSHTSTAYSVVGFKCLVLAYILQDGLAATQSGTTGKSKLIINLFVL